MAICSQGRVREFYLDGFTRVNSTGAMSIPFPPRVCATTTAVLSCMEFCATRTRVFFNVFHAHRL